MGTFCALLIQEGGLQQAALDQGLRRGRLGRESLGGRLRTKEDEVLLAWAGEGPGKQPLESSAGLLTAPGPPRRKRKVNSQ